VTFKEFHDNKMGVVGGADVEQRADIRMSKRRDSAGFAFETLESVRLRGESWRKDFDSDVATETKVSRAIDFAHTTRTEEAGDLVRAKARTGGKRHDEPGKIIEKNQREKRAMVSA